MFSIMDAVYASKVLDIKFDTNDFLVGINMEL